MNAFKTLVAVGSMGLFTIAHSHTAAVSSTPKDGSVLEASPPTIEIVLKSAARMTSVAVKREGAAERKLEFNPKSSSTTFKIDAPNLEPGRNEVHWIALAQDGHVTKGVIVLTIKPEAVKAL